MRAVPSTSTRKGRRERATFDSESCAVFLHIPKTAGQTLVSSLNLNYPRSATLRLDILDKPLDEQMKRIPLERRSEARLVSGHIPYGVHRHIPLRCEYITVFREPVARVISVYKYVLRAPNHVLHERVVETPISLDEYVESGMDEGQTENSQTRQVSGRQFGALGREALDEAKGNLEGFLVVGLTERFDETFALVRRSLRLRIPFYATRNVSPPFNISKRARELILERNELDLELYAFAHELFRSQIAAQRRSFGAEVAALKAMRPVSRVAGGKGESLLLRLSQTRAVRWLVS